MKTIILGAVLVAVLLSGAVAQAVLIYEDDLTTNKYLTDAEYLIEDPINVWTLRTDWKLLLTNRTVTYPDEGSPSTSWSYLIYEFSGYHKPVVTTQARAYSGYFRTAIAYQDPGNDPDSANWEYDQQEYRTTGLPWDDQFINFTADASADPDYNGIDKFWVLLGHGAYRIVANWSVYQYGWTAEGEVIPEPATIGILSLGALLMIRRRNKK